MVDPRCFRLHACVCPLLPTHENVPFSVHSSICLSQSTPLCIAPFSASNSYLKRAVARDSRRHLGNHPRFKAQTSASNRKKASTLRGEKNFQWERTARERNTSPTVASGRPLSSNLSPEFRMWENISNFSSSFILKNGATGEVKTPPYHPRFSKRDWAP